MTSVLSDLAGRPVVVGSGIAGLMAALTLAPEPIVLVTGGALGGATSSALAQGGIAASLGPDDSPELHAADTINAGDGLCDPAVVSDIAGAAGGIIRLLEKFGVSFDRRPEGAYSFGLEAAHSRRRILHADGDASGLSMVEALVRAVRSTPSITVLEHTQVVRLVTQDRSIAGLVCLREGAIATLPTSRVLLATGGIGGLYAETTNPIGNFGQGIALAAHAGARLCDMEFVQFHPTALRSTRRPMALVSEAVRGEGAVLVNGKGEPLMAGVPGGDLAPRDVVARAVAAEIRKGGACYLDARDALGSRFASRFPSVNRLCAEAGIDPARQLIPVVPAVHYHMGGIDVDALGRSSVRGLWAAGEVACSGLHGANRLASNSLLEAAALGVRAAEDMADTSLPAHHMRVESQEPRYFDIECVRRIASAHLGVIRDEEGLSAALAALLPLAEAEGMTAGPAVVALSIAVFAYLRRETRGSHARRDFSERTVVPQRRKMTLSDILDTARSHFPYKAIRSA